MSSLLAYFDPGSGSLVMQVLVGGTAGLIVFGKYLWNSAFSKPDHPQRGVAVPDGHPRSTDSSGEIPKIGTP
jgi:hypothetical protein